ncbi:O-antigen polysaccharide polymerase Wzy [Clostridium perfringens]|uniref:O-antigen polysaccharide polymerase Wzy n=1 Tax=Clostridium perfringens TaxID=1502 RepID=UPI001CC90DC8|nr:O-antigen polysaccharide polymerase Wzy [Clostridium perfringens]EHK2328210.1 O-antigen polysaccharide polymerase Wzy [Clostridium perfringens]MDM0477849.1 O-antigen polysaccharide polymerase Wzy [Clostridium perfringens]MDM0486160.1 O-antigen polysaccharide polymerase Wzy [Clostridium perfringens]UBK29535.1 oligosaccharide repeat unit polymerase [Clostridium perfringens]
MILNKKKLQFLLIQIIIFVLTILIFNINNISIKLLEINLLIQFIYSLFISFKLYSKLTNIFTFFLIASLVFGIGRVLLGIIGLGNFNQITWFSNEVINYNIQLKTILAIIISLQGLTIGFLIFKKISSQNEISFEPKIFNAAKYLFVIFGIFNFIRIINMLLFTLKSGYGNYYSYGYTNNIILAIADDGFKYSFYAILLSNPKWGTVKKYINVYFIFQLIIIFTGFRGQAFSEILVLIIYIAYKSNMKFNMKKLSLIGIIFIIIATISGNIRIGEKSYLSKNNFIVDFFNTQGYSTNVLALTIQDPYNKFENDINYILYPFKSTLNLNIDESLHGKVLNKSLPHVVSYLTNSYVYNTGGGMGGNYIAELYSIGNFISVLFGNILLAFIISFFDNRFFKNRYFIYFSMYIFPCILMLPRDYYFNYILNIFMCLFFLIFIILVSNILDNFRVKNSYLKE